MLVQCGGPRFAFSLALAVIIAMFVAVVQPSSTSLSLRAFLTQSRSSSESPSLSQSASSSCSGSLSPSSSLSRSPSSSRSNSCSRSATASRSSTTSVSQSETTSPTPSQTSSATPSRTQSATRHAQHDPSVGVFVVETRALVPDLATAPYYTLSAVINAAWARSHGYDFTFVVSTFNGTALPAAVAKAVDQACPAANLSAADFARAAEADHAPSKDAAAAWHPSLGVLRASPWTRLPALWNLTRGLRAALYFDSDVFVSRLTANAYELSRGPPVWGTVPPADAVLVLGANRPFSWRPTMPCTGVLLLRPDLGAIGLLRNWWDAPGWERNHAYEQDALWSIMDRSARGGGGGQSGKPSCGSLQVGPDTVSVVDIPQFPPIVNDAVKVKPADAYRWEPASFVYHTQEALGGGRQVVMRQRLAELGVGDPDTFAAAVRSIRSVNIDVIEVALAMHAASCAEHKACAS